MRRIISVSLVLVSLFLQQMGFSQVSSTDNDPVLSSWPEGCRRIDIISSKDGSLQPFIFLEASGKEVRPLIVSLHTWSGGYDQKDTLVWQCLENNYNYIHPHFRGRNNNPEACGSPEAITDIDDAIIFAINTGHVDRSQIHITGSSGGGYATLLAYMRSALDIKTFSAWVPISDLVKWFYESEGRKSEYSKDISKATGGWTDEKNYSVVMEEAVNRSPYYMKTPVEKRKFSKLNIYAGIHDGYTGSVPITQSILFYNKVVRDFNPAEEKALVSDQDIIEMISSRNYVKKPGTTIGDRVIHYEQSYKDRVRIVIFEGGHENLIDVALDHTGGKNILAIGDSNGAFPEGWVDQLKKIRSGDVIYNTCISGNTIGFDNNGQKKLNTLRNLDMYMNEAYEQMGDLDDIIIMLGTNDCKAVFKDSIRMVPDNFRKLLIMIRNHPVYMKFKPRIHVVSPPPAGRDEILIEKYHGGAQRIARLQPQFKKIAAQNGTVFVDVYSTLLSVWDKYSSDGIHLKPEGQKIIAETVNRFMDK